MTSGYLVAARERMDAEDESRRVLQALRDNAIYEPGPLPKYKARYLTPVGWVIIGCIAFWFVFAVVVWGM